MELDELKQLWHKENALTTGPQLERAQILALIRGRSHDAVARLRRNLTIELAACALFTIALVAWWLFSPNSKAMNLSMLLFLLVVLVPYTAFYAIKLFALQNFETESGHNLRQLLKQKAQQLNNLLNWYFYGSLALLPPAFFIGLFLGMNERGLQNAPPLLVNYFTGPAALLYILGASAGVVAVFFLPMRWYVNKVYSKHVDQLFKCLKELDEAQMA